MFSKINMKLLLAACIFAISLFALPAGAEEAGSTYDPLLPYVSLYNENISQIPGTVLVFV